MTRLSYAADRLATGSRILARRLAVRTAAWCARGRRDDLTGWKAVLGIVARALVLVLGTYVLARIVRALPALMWLLSSAWTLAAWRASRTPAEATEKAPAEEPPALDREAVRTLLLEVMGDASAVHLRAVLAHLQQRGQWKGRKVSDLRAALEALDIPVQPKVKARGGGPTRGVRRVDLAPSPATAPETSPTPSTAA
ncbi:hypothetical protein [Streptomyces sp. NPDC006285]|uniref:hypothetical protein n=1 Tax=Streptomyces sp. NPDC006285 TaxID=3364742 RepID=UPI00367967BF